VAEDELINELGLHDGAKAPEYGVVTDLDRQIAARHQEPIQAIVATHRLDQQCGVHNPALHGLESMKDVGQNMLIASAAQHLDGRMDYVGPIESAPAKLSRAPVMALGQLVLHHPRHRPVEPALRGLAGPDDLLLGKLQGLIHLLLELDLAALAHNVAHDALLVATERGGFICVLVSIRLLRFCLPDLGSVISRKSTIVNT